MNDSNDPYGFFKDYEHKSVEGSAPEIFKQLVYKTFKTKDGKSLIDMLVKSYLTAPVCPVNSPEGYGYFREGQNNIIRLFQQIIQGEQ